MEMRSMKVTMPVEAALARLDEIQAAIERADRTDVCSTIALGMARDALEREQSSISAEVCKQLMADKDACIASLVDANNDQAKKLLEADRYICALRHDMQRAEAREETLRQESKLMLKRFNAHIDSVAKVENALSKIQNIISSVVGDDDLEDEFDEFDECPEGACNG